MNIPTILHSAWRHSTIILNCTTSLKVRPDAMAYQPMCKSCVKLNDLLPADFFVIRPAVSAEVPVPHIRKSWETVYILEKGSINTSKTSSMRNRLVFNREPAILTTQPPFVSFAMWGVKVIAILLWRRAKCLVLWAELFPFIIGDVLNISLAGWRGGIWWTLLSFLKHLDR